MLDREYRGIFTGCLVNGDIIAKGRTMAANASVPPLVLDQPLDDPEHYEFIRGHGLKKLSVGREDHSELELQITLLLQPIAKQLKAKVLQEWTIVHGEEKLIPDVTFSFADRKTRDGYLVAPPFLVIETKSKGHRLKTLLEKCVEDYHRIGTPYCWVLDSEEQAAYECHRDMNGAHRLVSRLTAGPDIALSVADLGWQ
jgi:Uma2 family endonuclease